MKPKISIIGLGVRDFDVSFDFYHRGLGFPLHNYTPGEPYAMFKLEGTWLAIYPRERLAEDAGVEPEGEGFPGFTFAHNVGSADEVDAVFEAAVACGAEPVKIPEEAFWGGYSGYFADPDGFLWEVAYNPFTDLS